LVEGTVSAIAWIAFKRHAQGPAKGLEYRFALMMGVDASQVVDMQRDAGMVDQTLEEFADQFGVKRAQHGAGKGYFKRQARAAGKVDDHTAECFVQRHIGMAVTQGSPFIAHGTGQRLPQGDAHIFDCMVAVNVQVAAAFHAQVDQAVACNLLQHVIEEADTGIEFGLAAAIEIDGENNVGFSRFT
jgi:hypothetical protein